MKYLSGMMQLNSHARRQELLLNLLLSETLIIKGGNFQVRSLPIANLLVSKECRIPQTMVANPRIRRLQIIHK